MVAVFVVHHVSEHWGIEDAKFIGVYSTRRQAEGTIERLRSSPGFHLWPEGFTLAEHELDADSWSEGFTVLRTICVPVAKSADGASWRYAEAECLPHACYRIRQFITGEPDDELLFAVDDIVRCRDDDEANSDGPLAFEKA